MKKYRIVIASIFFGALSVCAQVNLQSAASASINDENPFLDASGYKRSANNIGKGLYFPGTDLRTWVFKTSSANPGKFSTYFDGMIVYNTGKGKTGTNAATQGVQVDVKPGFYYFSNPNGAKTKSISGGRWLPLGGDLSQSIGSSEGKSPVVVDTNQVYAVKGSFTSNGSTKARIEFPNGIKSIYSIRIYKKDGVAGTKIAHTQLYSYDLTARTGDNVVFGSGVMSTSIPEGDYEYVLEYMK